MFSFANPQYLYLLALLPAVAALFWWARNRRRKQLNAFGRQTVVQELMPDVSAIKPWVKLTLELLLLAVVIVIVARPRAGASKTTDKVHGIEVMVALDISNSMNASSTDNPQDISRLQRAKLIVQKMMDSFDNDKVGLIVFAGNAYMQMPMTSDVSSAKLFLNNISTNLAPTQGTAIGAAVTLAAQSFSPSKKAQKTIVVITDGENFEDDAASAAHQAQKQGIQVNVIGVGSQNGAPIPMPEGGFLTDDAGQTVTTFLNEKMAQDIAKAGKGVYINGAASDAVETLHETLDKLARTDLESVTYTKHDEQFPVFAALAICLLLGLLLYTERQSPWLQKYNFFTRKQSQP